jgi:hypothetical protein
LAGSRDHQRARRDPKTSKAIKTTAAWIPRSAERLPLSGSSFIVVSNSDPALKTRSPASRAFFRLDAARSCTRQRHGHGKERLEEARRLADWLISQEGQQAIGGYEIHGEQLFHPSAAAPK